MSAGNLQGQQALNCPQSNRLSVCQVWRYLTVNLFEVSFGTPITVWNKMRAETKPPFSVPESIIRGGNSLNSSYRKSFSVCLHLYSQRRQRPPSHLKDILKNFSAFIRIITPSSETMSDAVPVGNASRSRTFGTRTGTFPIPVMTSRSVWRPCRTTRHFFPCPVQTSFVNWLRNSWTSASTAACRGSRTPCCWTYVSKHRLVTLSNSQAVLLIL